MHHAALPPPLTAVRMLTAWTLHPGVVVGCVVLAVGYASGVRRVGRTTGPWPAARSVAWFTGVLMLVMVGSSFVAVYDDTLFWTRATQGVVLLLVAPMLLAASAPLTLARAALPPAVCARLGRIRRSRAARAVTAPGAVTVLLIAPPFVIHLTGLYTAMVTDAAVSGVVSVALLACGFVYAASRLQLDPLPRRTHHGLTLVIALVEIVADGVLGLVLWLGPLVAADHYLALGRVWGPDPRTDQVIGAGVWWLGGDVAGLPFLVAIMTRFAADDEARARVADVEQDLAAPVAEEEDDLDEREAARRRALWWLDDPVLAARFGAPVPPHADTTRRTSPCAACGRADGSHQSCQSW